VAAKPVASQPKLVAADRPLTMAEGLSRAIPYLKAGKKQNAYRAPSIKKMPSPPPGVVPAAGMAMDSADLLATNDTVAWGANATWDGYGFMGYALLAELTQIPEFRRPCEILANEMTRKWIRLTATGEGAAEKADKLTALEGDLKSFAVQECFRDAFLHDNEFGIGRLFIDVGATGDELKTPLDPSIKVTKGRLKAITLVDPLWTYPVRYNATNPLQADFYRPQTWFVNGQEVHHTRFLSFVSRPMPDILKPAYLFGGLSLIQMLRPYVENWLRTRQAVGDIVQNFSTPVLKTPLDKLTTREGAIALAERAEVYNLARSNQGLLICDTETEEFAIASVPLSSLDQLQGQSQEHMCLQKGTLIETDRGQVPVEDVTIRDRVMTRNGYAPVAWSGITKYVSTLTEIETNVSTIRVTEEHPVWSETAAGFVSARNVNRSHRLRKSHEWANTADRSRGAAGCGASQNTTQRDVANVLAVRQVLVLRQPVYDITVANGSLPEFFANGILVHNSAVAGIPLIKNFGITPAGLNASSDGEIRTFNDTLESLQERIGTPNLRRLLDILQLNRFGEIDPEIDFVWQPMWNLSEVELSTVRKTDAETDGIYVEMGAVDPMEIRTNLSDDPDSRYNGLDLDDPIGPDPDLDPTGGPDLGKLGGGFAVDPREERDDRTRDRGDDPETPRRPEREGRGSSRRDDRGRQREPVDAEAE
jgi:hypothetical protein